MISKEIAPLGPDRWGAVVPARHISPLARKGNAKRTGSRPVSRVLSGMVIHLGRASPRASCSLPGNTRGPRVAARKPRAPLFDLAPGGVCPATTVTGGAVRSYRTFSPLPAPHDAGLGRYVFCGTFRGLAPPRGYLAPRPAEPGLSSPPACTGRATIRPAPGCQDKGTCDPAQARFESALESPPDAAYLNNESDVK